MQPFEPNKNSKELGIDTTRKFVVLDKTHVAFNQGDILVFVETFNSVNNSLAPIFKRISDGREAACNWSRLAYAEPIKEFSASGLSVGDIVIDENNKKRKVLEVGKTSFLLSVCNDLNVAHGWYTFQEAIDNGWKIQGAEKSEIDEMIERLKKSYKDTIYQPTATAILDCIELLKNIKI